MSEARGPIDDRTWPATLTARAVTAGERPRVHGYDVEGDLARHYGFGEILLCTLTGELPDEATGRLFDVTMAFLGPISVAEAPSHAGCLARICGAQWSGVVSTGAVTLAEQARAVIEEHAELIGWLGATAALPSASAPVSPQPVSPQPVSPQPASAQPVSAQPASPLPGRYRAQDEAERRSLARYREATLAGGVALPILALDPTRTAALLAGLWACGARRREQLETLWLVARLGAVAAEAAATRPLAFTEYPMVLPPYRYVGADG